MNNRALVGIVNSGPRHFEAAVDRLRDLPPWFLDRYVTEVSPASAFEPAFERGGTIIKTAVEFGTHEER
jgi:hypothetical protein